MSIQLLIGTTSGNTEYLAEALATMLNQAGIETNLHDQPDLKTVPCRDASWLICVATHGAGEYAESIDQFMHDLATEKPDLRSVRAAIVSVGDSSYDTFCQAGIDAQQLVSDLGATLISERLDIDMMLDPDPEATASSWLQNTMDRNLLP